MEGGGEKADRAENSDGNAVDSTQKQPPEAPYRSVITIELNPARDTVQATGEESSSVFDSAKTIDPTDMLESNMEVDEDHIGMEYPYTNNMHSSNEAVILKCGVCDFIALDPEELAIHRKRFHPTPGVGHPNKEPRYTDATTDPPFVRNQQRENHGSYAQYNVERKALTIHGRSRNLWTCRLCGLASKTLGQVTSHVNAAHGITSTFMCYFCSALFTRKVT